MRRCLAVLLPVLLSAAEPTVQVLYTAAAREQDIAAQPVQTWTATAAVATPAVTVTIDPTVRHQTMAGIGAAFSEIGTKAILTLPEDRRRAVMTALFAVEGGAGLSMCRLPIGASDFATSAYSYAEEPEDYDLRSFSIARDQASIIPVVQQAKAINPELGLFASPWSPPGWMKVSGTMDGGGKDKPDNRLRDGERIARVWAAYLVKYLQAYQAVGLPIARLNPQNEIDMNPGYPGCVIPPERIVDLFPHALAPALKASGLATELWPGTFREDPRQPWATRCMADADFRACTVGLGIQYFNAAFVADLVKAHPGLRLMHTEANCHNGKNTATQAQGRMAEMIGVFNAGCDTYAYWNMVLDEQQESGWKWKQNSLVTIDRTAGTVRWNPDWQPVALVSGAVRPGDVRIDAQGGNGPVAAFRKPDGRVVVLLTNREPQARQVALDVAGRHLTAQVPPQADVALLITGL